MSEMSQNDREYLFFSNPETVNKICSHVANGGSVIDIATLSQIRYADIMKWIKSDKSKLDLYESALEDRKEWAKEKLLREIRQLSYFDIRLVLNDDGSVMPPKDWPTEVASAIVGMDVADMFEGKGEERIQTGILKKLKFVDKVKALEMQAKNLKLLTEQVEHTGAMSLEQLVSGSFKKD